MQWRKAFLNAGNEEGIPFVIIGNKIDLPTNVAESLV
jgi:GTPase SAR1 family protein